MPEFFATRFHVTMSHPVVRLIARVEQVSIRVADRIITPTEPMRTTFGSRGADVEKITVVMDGADEGVFRPASPDHAQGGFTRSAQDDARSELFVLISHGTIEPQYGLDTLIRATSLLAADVPGVQLRIIGDGSQRGELMQLAQRLGVGHRVDFSNGFIPQAQLVEALRTADVGVVAMRRDPFRDLTLAGKMFDFVAIGLPMVVSRTRSVEETLSPGCYEAFESGDAGDLAAALLRVRQDPARAHRLAATARDHVRDIAWPVQRRRYQELITSLVSAGTAGVRTGSRRTAKRTAQ